MADGSSDAGKRYIFYSHDGMGLGHARRNLALAAAVTGADSSASVLLATGTDELYRLGLPPRVEVLKLPALRKLANERYVSRRLAVPPAEISRLRRALLRASVEAFRPHLLLVDKHPIGASGELRPALDLLRDQGGRAVLGLRDILDGRAQVVREWKRHNLYALIAHYYDEVLVYGQENVLDAVREYEFPLALAQRTRYCGYVLNRAAPTGRSSDRAPQLAVSPHRPAVLATPGGGEDGSVMLEAFIRAAQGEAWQGIIVTGPLAPEGQRRSLQRLAETAGVVFHTFVPGLPGWFEHVDALVCMGGYNTLAEALSTGTPTVCVPRTEPRTEQLLRARALQRLDLLRTLEPERLSPENLRRAIGAALAVPREDLLARVKVSLEYDGARRAAERLMEVAGAPARTAHMPVNRLAQWTGEVA